MALAATTVWEVRTAGSDTTCSGGFVAGGGGTDYSQQDAAQYTGTNLVIDGAVNTKCTSATHNFVAADVGNLIQVTAGSGFTVGFYQIVSVAANAATVDRSLGTLGSTNGTFAVGGALATPGLAVANLVAGHIIYAKGGYTSTTQTVNVAGGRLDFNVSGTQTAYIRFIGYTSARGDGGKYTMTLGATFTSQLITTNNGNNYVEIRNVALVGNATAGSVAVDHNGRSNRIINLKISGYAAGSGDLLNINNNAFLKDFEISGCATGTNGALVVNGQCVILDGWIHGNAGTGMRIPSGGSGMIVRVISCDHTGANGYGWNVTVSGELTLFECGAWNNAQTDYLLGNSNATIHAIRCVSGGSGGYNWDNLTGPDSVALWYCAAKTNTTALFRTTPNSNVGMVTLTGDPFTNRAAGDFSPNTTAGAGAALRGVVETIFGFTTTYADVGLAQHQDSAVAATSYIRQVAMRGGGG